MSNFMNLKSTFFTVWKVLFVAGAAQFLVLLESTIITVAVSPIAADLGNRGWLAWVISGYLLAFGALLQPGGVWADRHGQRPVFLGSLLAFGVTSVLCALAPNIELLVTARVVQGGAAGALAASALGSVLIEYDDARRRAIALTAWSALGVVGAVVGSLIAGPLFSSLGWPGAFWVNVAAVAALVPSSWRIIRSQTSPFPAVQSSTAPAADPSPTATSSIPSTTPSPAPSPTDPSPTPPTASSPTDTHPIPSTVSSPTAPSPMPSTTPSPTTTSHSPKVWPVFASALGAAAILAGLSVAESKAISGIAIAGIGACLAIITITAQWRSTNPILPIRLFRFASYRIAAAGLFVGNGLMIATMFAYSRHIQGHYGLSPQAASLAVLPMALAALITAFTADMIISRLSLSGTFRLATSALVLGAGGMLLVSVSDAAWKWLIAGGVLIGAGLPLCFVILNRMAFEQVEAAAAGVASGFTNTLTTLGGAVTVSLTALTTSAFGNAGAYGMLLLSSAILTALSFKSDAHPS